MLKRWKSLAAGAVVVAVAACGGAASPSPTQSQGAPSPSAPGESPVASPSGDGLPTLSPDGESVTINFLSAFAPGSVFNGPQDLYIETVEENSGGRVSFNVDGPEVVPITEAITALSNRVYDVHYNVPLFHTGVVPAGEAIYFISGESSCQEYRDAGALDIYDEIHRETAGVFFLGCGGGGAHGATFLIKDPITSVDEFQGMTFRGFGLYTRVLDELGATSVALPPGDVYGALERGVIDGAAFPNLGIIEFALHEVTPYIVMPPYLPFRYAFYGNPDSFEALPEDVRTFMQDTLYALEDDFDAYWVEKRDAEAVQLEELGMEEVRLSGEESTRLETIIQEELWSFIVESSPLGQQLRDAFEDIEG